MKLEKLTLANFRGFEQIDLDFSEDVTVIAGVNGVGKSGVLKALAVALSLALPKFTPSREASLNLSDSDIQVGKAGLSLAVSVSLPSAAIKVDIARAAALESDEAETLKKRRDDLRFATRETPKGSREELQIQDEIRRIELLLAKPSDIATVRILPANENTSSEEWASTLKAGTDHPIAVFYSSARLLSRLRPELPTARGVDSSAAYTKALSQLEVSLHDFASWYRVVAAGEKTEVRERLFQQLERAIQTFLPDVTDLRLAETPPPRFRVRKGGKAFSLEQLSDGERGLLALVFDLTRRLAIANPTSDNPIAEGIALVLIDEIEMHMHPKWQRDVLQRLRDTFRSCQFVVTTHSPLLLGEVEARCVRFLDVQDGRVQVTVPSEAYGMDANRILQELMGAPVRNRQVDEELRALFVLIDEERFGEARAAILELERKLGSEEPELTRASALIRFLGGDD